MKLKPTPIHAVPQSLHDRKRDLNKAIDNLVIELQGKHSKNKANRLIFKMKELIREYNSL